MVAFGVNFGCDVAGRLQAILKRIGTLRGGAHFEQRFNTLVQATCLVGYRMRRTVDVLFHPAKLPTLFDFYILGIVQVGAAAQAATRSTSSLQVRIGADRDRAGRAEHPAPVAA